ncbi:MAG: hypothetical protein QCI00_04975 [Candidatus Thermoplasmatota archaeon]|nr:hypothetical protein [Candidatus Thermoplasmatota archaeon]
MILKNIKTINTLGIFFLVCAMFIILLEEFYSNTVMAFLKGILLGLSMVLLLYALIKNREKKE